VAAAIVPTTIGDFVDSTGSLAENAFPQDERITAIMNNYQRTNMLILIFSVP
jgi:hypothetical protein